MWRNLFLTFTQAYETLPQENSKFPFTTKIGCSTLFGGNNLLNKIKGGLLITLFILHLLYVIQVTTILRPY